MKLLKPLALVLLSSLLILLSLQCTSAKNTKNNNLYMLQEELPLDVGQVYFQKWVAGVKGGGSGIKLYIPIVSNLNNVLLDSVYFRGRKAKLEKIEAMFVANFLTTAILKDDIIMSNEPNAEYGNQMPNKKANLPFEIEEDACVISYIEKGVTKYFKIHSVKEKEALYYPSAPPRNKNGN